jgi:hypothetical protein
METESVPQEPGLEPGLEERLPEPGELNIQYQAACKICKKDLVVDVDAWFANNQEPALATWLQMATCSRCYDLMLRRDRAEQKIKVQCEFLIRAVKIEVETRNVIFNLVKDATKEYAKVIADYHSAEPPPWNDAYARMLMEKPEQWNNTLNSYRQSVKVTMQKPLIDPQEEEAPQDA